MSRTILQFVKILSVCVAVLLNVGCMRRSKLQQEPVKYVCEQEQAGVQVVAEMMSATAMKDMFGVNFFNYGIVPIILTINNQTSDSLLLRGQSVHVSLEDPYDVAQAAHYSTLLITSYSSYLSCIFFWPALLPSLGAGLYMSRANAAVTQAVCSRGLAEDDSLDILPYEQVSRVLFVPANDFNAQFRMHLFNVHAKTFIPFSIAFNATTPWQHGEEAVLADLSRA